MTSTGLASPPRAAPSRVHQPAPRSPEPPRRPERSPPPFGRIFGWALVASALLHLLALFLTPFTVRLPTEPSPGPAASADASSFGTQLIVPIPSENAPENPPIDLEREPPLTRSTTPTAVRPRSPGSTSGANPNPAATPPPAGGGSASDALRPGYRDSRLYVETDEFPELRRTDHEIYMERLQARIDAVNDSMGIAAARERRTSDWTYTDDSGNRWGLDPDGLHLGGITIPRAVLPLPGPTGDNQSLEAERERLRMRGEILDQADRAEREATERERIEAIREQQDRSRQNDDGT